MALHRLGEHGHQPLALVPRTTTIGARPGTITMNVLVRVRRNLFYRYFGLGPDTTADGESSYTRLFAIGSTRIGWNFTSRPQPGGVYGELRGDRPERHAIKGLPETQDVYPDAPGLDGAALVRAGLSIRFDTRAQGDYSPLGFATELTASLARGSPGVGRFGQLSWTARGLVPELQVPAGGGARLLDAGHRRRRRPFLRSGKPGRRAAVPGVPGGPLHRHGRLGSRGGAAPHAVSDPHFRGRGRLALDPFVAAGQVYGQDGPLRTCASRRALGLRMWIRPDILGRVDVAYGGEGVRAYVVLGYPY